MSGSRFSNIAATAFAEIFGNDAQPVSGGWNLPLPLRGDVPRVGWASRLPEGASRAIHPNVCAAGHAEEPTQSAGRNAHPTPEHRPENASDNFREAGPCVSARVEDFWLVMSSPAAAEADALDLLARNGVLRGGVKFGRNGHTEIRVEIPLEEDAPVAAAIREAWIGFESALSGEASPSTEPPVAPDSLAALCAEAGWPATPRADGSLAVELETRGAFVQCSLEAGRASVALASFLASEGDSSAAISALLLEAACGVRMARPVVETRDGEVRPRFEVVFAAPPDAAQLAHALSALSVAWRLCGEEAKALKKKDVAGEYLALRARRSGRVRSVNTNRKETP